MVYTALAGCSPLTSQETPTGSTAAALIPYQTSTPEKIPTGNTDGDVDLESPTPATYVVVEGDTFFTIAARLGIANGEAVRVVTRRGQVELQAQTVRTIRPDTVFVPYHWPGKKSANLLTNRALDPISRIPEYKVCACRIEKVTP